MRPGSSPSARPTSAIPTPATSATPCQNGARDLRVDVKEIDGVEAFRSYLTNSSGANSDKMWHRADSNHARVLQVGVRLTKMALNCECLTNITDGSCYRRLGTARVKTMTVCTPLRLAEYTTRNSS